MKRRIPPLTAVVAFAAVARHKSFKNASDELCVSPSAVSHQIRALEEWLGAKIFERSTRKLELTDFGLRYITDVNPLLDELAKCSSRETQTLKKRKIVNVQTTDSVASRWLIPNLHDFQAFYPTIAVKIITHDYRDSLRESEVDVGILFVKNKRLAGTLNKAVQLFAEEIFPVCSPELIKKKQLSKIAHLESFPLIHDDNVGVSWQEWILATDASQKQIIAAKANRGCHYNHAHLALQCAELGGGITLASNALTTEAVKKGRLVAPFDKKIITGNGYYLVCSTSAKKTPECKSFADWIISKRLIPGLVNPSLAV